MGEKKPKQRGKPEWAAALLWLSPPALVPGLDCGASGRGTDLPAEGLGRAHRAWRAAARREADPSEAVGKMTLGPERKTSGRVGVVN